MIPQYVLGIYLGILALGGGYGAMSKRRLPPILVFDRDDQQRMLLGMTFGSMVEAAILWSGGFFG